MSTLTRAFVTNSEECARAFRDWQDGRIGRHRLAWECGKNLHNRSRYLAATPVIAEPCYAVVLTLLAQIPRRKRRIKWYVARKLEKAYRKCKETG